MCEEWGMDRMEGGKTEWDVAADGYGTLCTARGCCPHRRCTKPACSFCGNTGLEDKGIQKPTPEEAQHKCGRTEVRAP